MRPPRVHRGRLATLYRTSFVSSAGSRVPRSSSSVRKRVLASIELPALAADLVRSKPDLIVAFAPQPARAVKDATSEIPIVMIFVADPVGMGLVSSLAHPGGNLTGVTTLVPGGFMGKSLDILRDLLPQAKRLAAFINPSNEIHRLLFPRDALPAPPRSAFSSTLSRCAKPEEIPGAIATAKARGAEALYIVGDPIFNSAAEPGARSCGTGRPTVDLL